MEHLENIKQIDPWAVFGIVIVTLSFWSFIQGLWEKTIGKLLKKLDIETKGMREKREARELLKATAELAKTTAENLDELQQRHTKDEEEFRKNLNSYMEESRKDRKTLHDEMTKYSNNRVADRKQSLQIQKELVASQKDSDAKIEALTSLFVDKEIDDYRWEIINFATKVSEKKPCNRDSFKHCLRTYEKYEALLEKYGFTISIDW